MKIKTIIFIVSISCGLAACNGRSARLKKVLEYSGENRHELEKVLEHYAKNPADSLKYQSAVFLIENMPGHYTFGGTYMEEYIAKIDSLKNTSYQIKKVLQTLPGKNLQLRSKITLQEDVKYITAEFLIHNIETAFRLWQTQPWLADVDFETFREYLLPYRVENEPLDNWRDSIKSFKKNMEYTLKYYDDRRHRINLLYSDISRTGHKSIYTIPDPAIRSYEFDCVGTCLAGLFALRTVGIPACIDFIPAYADRNASHYWTTAIDLRVKHSNVQQIHTNTVGKIFRKTFSHQSIAIGKKNEYVPPLFQDPFIKDITELYLNTVDVTVKFNVRTNNKYAYLAVFNNLEWKPIYYGEISGKKVTFKNMGKNIMYLPVYYNGEEMLPLAPPFILDNRGVSLPVISDTDTLQTIKMVRKYPYSYSTIYWINILLNGRFEAADNPLFKNADTIYTIRKKPNYAYETIPVDSSLKKRYWRFASMGYSGFAELEFIDKNGICHKGKVIGEDTTQMNALFDKDPLTYRTLSSNFEFDFGKPISFKTIRYLPRNDANGIYPDNEYELFYYQFPEGWKSLGMKTATEYSITYDNVPSGKLY